MLFRRSGGGPTGNPRKLKFFAHEHPPDAVDIDLLGKGCAT